MREVYRAERPAGPSAWFAGLWASLAGARLTWQPAAALTLLAVGFFGGRTTEDLWSGRGGAAGHGGQVAVRQQGLLNTRGNSNDPMIRGLLINSVQSSHSGARLESLEALGHNLADSEIREALIRAMVEDENPGVRIKALEALKPHAKDADVRAALVSSVRGDDNPGMRVMAIDLLTAEPDRELAGVLQQLVAAETDDYVRMRCRKALLELNASVDTY
jgi:hypothetical protein